MKVIKCLGRGEKVLAALDLSGFSPYERLAETGLKVSELEKQRAAHRPKPSGAKKRRVRHARREPDSDEHRGNRAVTVQWPEDKK